MGARLSDSWSVCLSINFLVLSLLPTVSHAHASVGLVVSSHHRKSKWTAIKNYYPAILKYFDAAGKWGEGC